MIDGIKVVRSGAIYCARTFGIDAMNRITTNRFTFHFGNTYNCRRIIMSEEAAKYVTESDREKAQTIAKLCWYYGRSSLQRLAWYLDIRIDEVEDIIESDEHLAAIEELIRTRPNRSSESVEYWWRKNWADMPSKFGNRMRLSEEAVSELIERVLSRT